MGMRKNLIHWIAFFITTAIIFGFIAIPSYLYWSNGAHFNKAILYGGAGSIIFGLIYATYKYKTLYSINIELDFSEYGVNSDEWIEKELVRLGYISDDDEKTFVAGFRADYYMAPDIFIENKSEVKSVSGPAFYLKKLKRRFLRRKKRFLKSQSIDR
jgi:hypothetical protein